MPETNVLQNYSKERETGDRQSAVMGKACSCAHTKPGGAGDMFGGYLCEICANLQRLKKYNQFTFKKEIHQS